MGRYDHQVHVGPLRFTAGQHICHAMPTWAAGGECDVLPVRGPG